MIFPGERFYRQSIFCLIFRDSREKMSISLHFSYINEDHCVVHLCLILKINVKQMFLKLRTPASLFKIYKILFFHCTDIYSRIWGYNLKHATRATCCDVHNCCSLNHSSNSDWTDNLSCFSKVCCSSPESIFVM